MTGERNVLAPNVVEKGNIRPGEQDYHYRMNKVQGVCCVVQEFCESALKVEISAERREVVRKKTRL